MMSQKSKELQIPLQECNRCGYQWYLRAEIGRNIHGKITEVELVEPKNCPNPKCKSPNWNNDTAERFSEKHKQKMRAAWKRRKG